jgi:hypothetical protein
MDRSGISEPLGAAVTRAGEDRAHGFRPVEKVSSARREAATRNPEGT